MEDKLKDFVRQNREAFDAAEPPDKLWEQLAHRLEPAKEARTIPLGYRQWLNYAATLLLFVAAGYGGWHFVRDQTTDAAAPVAAAPPLEKVAPELAQAERYYTTLINQKKAELSREEIAQLNLEGDWDRDLGQLDSAYVALKKELYANPNQEKVVDAMIRNLQIRMDILNQQLEVLEKIKQYQRKKEDENVSV